MKLMSKLIVWFAGSFLLGNVANTAEVESSFQVVHGWPELPPGFALQIVGGVAADDQGRVYTIHSARRA